MKIKLFLTLFGLIFLSGCQDEKLNQIVYGQVCASPSKEAPSKDAPPQKPDEKSNLFKLNPDSLRQQLLNENTSILLGINQVYQSKDQVNISRANLLPHLNLSALIYAAGNPTFTSSSVNILLPFLVPSNWTKYKQSKSGFYAQIEALKSIRLNVYASAYSLAQSVASDLKLRAILNSEVQDLSRVALLVERLYQNGVASKSDLERAVGQKLLSEINLSKVDGLLAQEISSIKNLLGLPTTTSIDVENFTISESEFESLQPTEILTRAKEISTELKQLFYIQKAAKEGTSTQRYAFIGGAGAQSPSLKEGDGSVAFDNISIGANFDIGYARFPMIELSEHQQQEIQLRTLEAERELADRSEYSWLL
ncbi:MAG TPA: TolC family protein [Pseudobdellovibrionaceae bacterium]|nr:TolC family protein [Pseudobdellovibrionaceae bacterium]